MGIRSLAIEFLFRTIHRAYGFELGFFRGLRVPQKPRSIESNGVSAPHHGVRVTWPETGHGRADRDDAGVGREPAFRTDHPLRPCRKRGDPRSPQHTLWTPGARSEDRRRPRATDRAWWVRSRLDVHACRCIRRIYSRDRSHIQDDACYRAARHSQRGAHRPRSDLWIAYTGGRNGLRTHPPASRSAYHAERRNAVTTTRDPPRHSRPACTACTDQIAPGSPDTASPGCSRFPR